MLLSQVQKNTVKVEEGHVTGSGTHHIIIILNGASCYFVDYNEENVHIFYSFDTAQCFLFTYTTYVSHLCSKDLSGKPVNIKQSL